VLLHRSLFNAEQRVVEVLVVLIDAAVVEVEEVVVAEEVVKARRLRKHWTKNWIHI
jgi:hypothetical protein